LNGKVAAPGLENREYGRGDPLRRPRNTLYPQKLALSSPTSGGRSVGIVRLRTKATEFSSVHTLLWVSCQLLDQTEWNIWVDRRILYYNVDMDYAQRNNYKLTNEIAHFMQELPFSIGLLWKSPEFHRIRCK
jgi:hypothetical protein